MTAPNSDQPCTVLLVDDQQELRAFVGQVLQRSGFRVLEADSGFKALEIAQAEGDKIELLLSNIQMPGMTGIELATQINVKCPRIKVLLMSGYTTGLLVLDRGWEFIHKPFLPDRLIEKVRSALNSARHSQGAPPLPNEEGR